MAEVSSVGRIGAVGVMGMTTGTIILSVPKA